MLTICSPVQRAHRPAYVVKQGERSASFDVPERVDSILSAISESDLIIAVNTDNCKVPTVSEWGMVVLALLLLISGKVYFGRRDVLVG